MGSSLSVGAKFGVLIIAAPENSKPQAASEVPDGASMFVFGRKWFSSVRGCRGTTSTVAGMKILRLHRPLERASLAREVAS